MYKLIVVIVPVYDGREGVDWSDLSTLKQYNKEVPDDRLVAVGCTVTCFSNTKKEDKATADARSISFNLQFVMLL
jgi:hypothetical protein